MVSWNLQTPKHGRSLCKSRNLEHKLESTMIIESFDLKPVPSCLIGNRHNVDYRIVLAGLLQQTAHIRAIDSHRFAKCSLSIQRKNLISVHFIYSMSNLAASVLRALCHLKKIKKSEDKTGIILLPVYRNVWIRVAGSCRVCDGLAR